MTDPATDAGCSHDAAPPPARPLIEIVALGRGPRGFRCLRLNGEEQADASLLMDLHSALRVRIGARVYDETDADIRVVDA